MFDADLAIPKVAVPKLSHEFFSANTGSSTIGRFFPLPNSRALVISDLHSLPAAFFPLMKGGIKASEVIGTARGLPSMATIFCKAKVTASFAGEGTLDSPRYNTRVSGNLLWGGPNGRVEGASSTLVDVHGFLEGCLWTEAVALTYDVLGHDPSDGSNSIVP